MEYQDNQKTISGKKPYKEPVFLFTSSSMRLAAWAGWYSALGNKDESEAYVHMAHAEWSKELGLGRRFDITGRYNNDVWKYISKEKLKALVDEFFRKLKTEVKKGKLQKQSTHADC